MKSILAKQAEIQRRYARLAHFSLVDPGEIGGDELTFQTSEAYKYLLNSKRYFDEEFEELLLELSNGDRAIHKPWSKKHAALHTAIYRANDKTRGEAIDMLCFAMNMLLAAGITPENIEAEYDKVYQKNLARQESDY